MKSTEHLNDQFHYKLLEITHILKAFLHRVMSEQRLQIATFRIMKEVFSGFYQRHTQNSALKSNFQTLPKPVLEEFSQTFILNTFTVDIEKVYT